MGEIITRQAAIRRMDPHRDAPHFFWEKNMIFISG